MEDCDFGRGYGVWRAKAQITPEVYCMGSDMQLAISWTNCVWRIVEYEHWCKVVGVVGNCVIASCGVKCAGGCGEAEGVFLCVSGSMV